MVIVTIMGYESGDPVRLLAPYDSSGIQIHHHLNFYIPKFILNKETPADLKEEQIILIYSS
jgi:hypothetical protein